MSPTIGWWLLALFGTAWIALGVFWGRKAKNFEGFMLAGRNVGLALGAATAMATWVTSNTVMLAPKFALQMGIWGMLAYSTASFGLFLFAPLAFRIRRLMPHGFTSGDFIRLRFGKPACASCKRPSERAERKGHTSPTTRFPGCYRVARSGPTSFDRSNG